MNESVVANSYFVKEELPRFNPQLALRAARQRYRHKWDKYYFGIGYVVAHESQVRWELKSRIKKMN